MVLVMVVENLQRVYIMFLKCKNRSVITLYFNLICISVSNTFDLLEIRYHVSWSVTLRNDDVNENLFAFHLCHEYVTLLF